MRTSFGVLASLMVGAPFVACGEAQGGASDEVTDEERLAELSEPQLDRLCSEWSASDAGDVWLHAACLHWASDAETVDACKDAYERCMQVPTCIPERVEADSACDLPVGELRGCVGDAVSELEVNLGELGCADLDLRVDPEPRLARYVFDLDSEPMCLQCTTVIRVTSEVIATTPPPSCADRRPSEHLDGDCMSCLCDAYGEDLRCRPACGTFVDCVLRCGLHDPSCHGYCETLMPKGPALEMLDRMRSECSLACTGVPTACDDPPVGRLSLECSRCACEMCLDEVSACDETCWAFMDCADACFATNPASCLVTCGAGGGLDATLELGACLTDQCGAACPSP